MTQILGHSQNPKVIEAVQQIMFTMFAVFNNNKQQNMAPNLAGTTAAAMHVAYLMEKGFAGLLEAGSFNFVPPAKKKQAAIHASQLVQAAVKSIMTV